MAAQRLPAVVPLAALTEEMTFVVASRRLSAMPNWVSVTEVFKSTSDAPFLKKAGISGFDDPRYEQYTKRLGRLRAIKQYG